MSINSKVVPLPTERRSRNRGQLARLPAPVHALQDKARKEIAEMLQVVFEQADDALFKLADQAANNQDQNLYFESMREVRIQRRTIENNFFDQLEGLFAALTEDNSAAELLSAVSEEIELENLSLVNNDELEELVAIDAMVARANKEHATAIEHITLRLDSLFEGEVSIANNPVAPASICEGFSRSSENLLIDIKAKLVLYKLFGKHVMAELKGFYQQLNKVLVDHQVLPNLISDLKRGRQPVPGPSQRMAASQMTGAVGTDIAAGESHFVDEGITLAAQGGHTVNLGELLGARRAAAAGVGGGSVQTTELLQTLNTLQQTSSTGFDGRVDLAGALANALNAQGQAQEIKQADNDVINLVNLLFDYILEDSNLAVEMKAQIGRLQIPFLKVALADKTFFSHGGHPARRLLNEIASAALGWQQEDMSGDILLKKIVGTIDRVLNEFESDAGLFAVLLTDFVSFTEKEKRRAAILEQRTIDAESGKAKSEQARATVEEALGNVIGDRELPEGAKDLLDQAWSKVMLLVCLKHGVDDPKWDEVMTTATDLVWSVCEVREAEDRSRLLSMLPSMLKRIRQGLESISFNPFDMQKLMQRLEKLHLAQLSAKPVQKPVEPRPIAEESSSDSLAATATSVQKTAERATATSSEPKAQRVGAADKTASPSQARAKALAPEQIAGDMNTIDGAPEKTKSAQTAASTAVESEVDEVELDAHYLSQVDRLTQGTWFEMQEEGQQVYRCRLAAIIKSPGKFIFVNRSGTKVAEKNRQSLALALQLGTLNQLDDGMLFDRALESVIGNLRARESQTG